MYLPATDPATTAEVSQVIQPGPFPDTSARSLYVYPDLLISPQAKQSPASAICVSDCNNAGQNSGLIQLGKGWLFFWLSFA